MDVLKTGIPVITFITEPFRTIARMIAASTLGPGEPPIVVLPHVFETLAPDAGRGLADGRWHDILAMLP